MPSGRELTPLGQGGGAVFLEDGAAVEVAVEAEVTQNEVGAIELPGLLHAS